MNVIQRGMVFASLIAMLMVLPGCWDYEQINRRASVIGIGIDPVENDPQKFSITFQIPILGGSKGSGGASAPPAEATQAKDYDNVSAEGYSLAEVSKDIQAQIDRNIDFADIRIIIINEKLTSTQVNSIIEDIIRDARVDKLAWLVTTPQSAQEILATPLATGIPSEVLSKKFDASLKQHGHYIRRHVWEFWRDYTQIGITPMLPVVKEETDQNGGDQQNAYSLGGLATYLKLHPDLELTDQQAIWVNILTGKAMNMAVDIPTNEGTFTLSEVKTSAQMRCVRVNGTLHLIDKIKIKADLSSSPQGQLRPMRAVDLDKLQKESAAYLKTQVEQTLALLQSRGDDVSGFGRIYLQSHPEQEDFVRNQWAEAFKTAVPNIDINIHIIQKGSLI